MLKTKKLKTPIYGCEFTIVVYDNDDDFHNKFKNLSFKENPTDYDGCVFGYEGKKYIVFTNDKKGYPTPGIIAHEAKHLVNDIFIEICHELDRHNDEPECYLLGWVVNRIHEFINQHGIGSKD